MQEGSPFSESSPTPVVSCVIDVSHSDRCDMIVILICISLISDDEHFSCVSVGHLDVFFGEMSVHLFCLFFKWVVFWVLSYTSSLYILYISHILDMSLANIFSHSIDCLLVLLIVTFAVQKHFILM